MHIGLIMLILPKIILILFQSCPGLPAIENGNAVSTGVTYGKFAQFTCDEEYQLEGKSKPSKQPISTRF